jgi:lactoylglutathione lyase
MNLDTLIKGVSHIGVRVHDLARSRAFYEKLGFKFVVGPIGPEPVAIVAHPSGVEVNFILNAAKPDATNILMDVPEKHPGYTHIALDVSDVAAVEAELKGAGVALSGTMTFPHGGKAIFVRDPDRNVIEFNQKPQK